MKAFVDPEPLWYKEPKVLVKPEFIPSRRLPIENNINAVARLALIGGLAAFIFMKESFSRVILVILIILILSIVYYESWIIPGPGSGPGLNELAPGVVVVSPTVDSGPALQTSAPPEQVPSCPPMSVQDKIIQQLQQRRSTYMNGPSSNYFEQEIGRNISKKNMFNGNRTGNGVMYGAHLPEQRISAFRKFVGQGQN